MKIGDIIDHIGDAYTAYKWLWVMGATVAVLSSVFYLGWHEKGLRCDAADLAAQNKAVVVHEGQEADSQQAGKDTEHAKQNAREAIDAVVKSSQPSGAFTADSVREQTNLIAAGESALKRQY